MLNNCYNNSETFVISGKEWIGDTFKTRMGLPHDQEISPILLELLIADYHPNTNGEDYVGILECTGEFILIRAIFFVDDLVLTASCRDKLCELCDIFKVYYGANKVTMKNKKTKEMILFLREKSQRLMQRKSKLANNV